MKASKEKFNLEQLFSGTGVGPRKVQEIIEKAVVVAWESDKGPGYQLEVKVSNSELKIFRLMNVVNKSSDDIDSRTEIQGEKEGEVVKEAISLHVFSKVAVDIMLNEIGTLLHNAKKLEEYEEYKKKEGEIISCRVAAMKHKAIEVITSGGARGVIEYPKHRNVEKLSLQSTVLCRLQKVVRSDLQPQLHFDRTSPQFVQDLLADLIPDVKAGLIRIKALARNLGSKVKLLLQSDLARHSIGPCIGLRGANKKQLQEHLNKENVDFISWDDDAAFLVANCFLPQRIEAKTVIFYMPEILVVVADEDYAKAIGPCGEDVQLVQKLLSASRPCRLKIIKISNYEEEKQKQRIEIGEQLLSFGCHTEEVNKLLSSVTESISFAASGLSSEEIFFHSYENISPEEIELSDHLYPIDEKIQILFRMTSVYMPSHVTEALEKIIILHQQKRKEILLHFGFEKELLDRAIACSTSVFRQLMRQHAYDLKTIKSFAHPKELAQQMAISVDEAVLLWD